MQKTNRRDFIKTTGTVAGAADGGRAGDRPGAGQCERPASAWAFWGSAGACIRTWRL